MRYLTGDSLKKYDVIVVGASFASLPLITRLDKKLTVLLLTGGEKVETKRNKQLSSSEEYGHFRDHFRNHTSRSFGGASDRWNGYTMEMDERDFVGSGLSKKWPLKYSDLKPYYLSAAEFLGRDPITTLYQHNFLNSDFICKPFSLPGEKGPTRLIAQYENIKRQTNVDILENTSLVRLGSKREGAISSLFMCDAARRTYELSVNSRQMIVLACGGIGNAQILLQPDEGSSVSVGNESGVVGRYLMEHPHTTAANIFLDQSSLPALPDEFGRHVYAFKLNDRSVKRENLLNCTLGLHPISYNDIDSELLRFIQTKIKRPLNSFLVLARAEQMAHSLNKVTLSPDKNWAGLHKVKTFCAFSIEDLWSIERTTILFGEMLSRFQLGILRLENDNIFRRTSGGGHIMGTTVMGTDPRSSVCDSTNRVHGYKNLYLSGSSVFTSSGAANPTLTIVALAMRLADTLNRKLRG